MPAQPDPPTVAEAVRRAVSVCDPVGQDTDLDALLRRFEDRDEPITVILDIEAELDGAARAIDAEISNPALRMAIALVAYLAHRRDELGEERGKLLRLAARAEFDGDPPPAIVAWLEANGSSP